MRTGRIFAGILSSVVWIIIVCSAPAAIDDSDVDNAAAETTDVLIGEGVARVLLGGGNLRYEAEINVLIADDGRFVFRIYNHSIYSEREIVFSYDGSDYYYLIPHQDRPGYAYLSSDTEGPPMIVYGDDVRDALWMAVGSGGFLEKRGLSGEMVYLFAAPRLSIAAYGFRYEAKLINDRFAIPRSFSIYRDKSIDMEREEEEKRLGFDLNSVGGTVGDERWESRMAWEDGSRAMDIVWDRERTLENGLVLPAEVTVTGYRSRQPEGEPPPIWRQVNIHFSSWQRNVRQNQSFQPEINQTLSVTDSRLRRRDGDSFVDEIGYVIASGGDGGDYSSWVPKNDQSIRRRFEESIEPFPQRDDEGMNISRYLLVSLAILALVLPIVILKLAGGGRS